MSLESELKTCLSGVAGGRVYPDDTQGVAMPLTYPLMIYQSVGGQAREYFDQSLPDKDHARVQLVAWAKTRLEASQVIRQGREAILGHGWPAQTYGAAVSIKDQTLDLYGARQDFGVFYTP
jgi:hypothetical protein